MVNSTLIKALMIDAGPELNDEKYEVKVLTWNKAPSFEELQEYVGGYIQVIYIASEHIADDITKDMPHEVYSLVVNEEGSLLNLKENIPARMITGMPIVGNAMLFIGEFPDEDDDGEES